MGAGENGPGLPVDDLAVVGEEQAETPLVVWVAFPAYQAAVFHFPDLAGDQCLVATHLSTHVLQAEPGGGADQFEQADVGRRQVEPFRAQAILEACAQVVEHFRQGLRQISGHRASHGLDGVNAM
ncbi:hypothetical protein D3C78_1181900 [compost metagenome]